VDIDVLSLYVGRGLLVALGLVAIYFWASRC
jgi:hypothetical protein